MGLFEQVALRVSALPMDQQDLIVELIQLNFDEDFNPRSVRNEAQIEIVKQKLAKVF